MNFKEILGAHKVLAELHYKPVEVNKGYANQTLYINLSENRIEIKPVTAKMKELMTGGRGFNLWLMWQNTTKDTKWDSEDNELCISGGPLCGTPSFPGSGKSIVSTISPLTGTFFDSNVGGHFGPLLKFSGFDSIEIQGKAKEDVMILINSETRSLTIETAPLEPVDTHILAEYYTEAYAKDEKDKQNMSIVSAGSASEHTRMGCLNVSFWDNKKQVTRIKQAGRGGVGTVFRDKKLKAIVVKTPNTRAKWVIQRRVENEIQDH